MTRRNFGSHYHRGTCKQCGAVNVAIYANGDPVRHKCAQLAVALTPAEIDFARKNRETKILDRSKQPADKLRLALHLIKLHITADETQQNRDLHRAVGLIVDVCRDRRVDLAIDRCGVCGALSCYGDCVEQAAI